MDATLAAILRALFQAHQELDTLREEVKRLQAQVRAQGTPAADAPLGAQRKAVP